MHNAAVLWLGCIAFGGFCGIVNGKLCFRIYVVLKYMCSRVEYNYAVETVNRGLYICLSLNYFIGILLFLICQKVHNPFQTVRSLRQNLTNKHRKTDQKHRKT